MRRRSVRMAPSCQGGKNNGLQSHERSCETPSALDAESESLIKFALKELTQSMTVIVIAHRLSTVLEADKIIVMQDGSVVEEGSLDELKELNGAFRNLFDMQFQNPKSPTKTKLRNSSGL